MTEKTDKLFIFVLLILVVLFGFYYVLSLMTEQQKRSESWKVKRQEIERARIELTSEALQEWMVLLELPQFEDKKKREEAARQLSIVLSDQLMLGRKIGSRHSESLKRQ